MRQRFYAVAFGFLFLFPSCVLLSQTLDQPFRIVTYPKVTIPQGLGEIKISQTIKNISENLQWDLQSEIQKLPHGRIVFLERDLITQLEEVLELDYEYENVSAAISKIVRAVPKKTPAAAVLFIKVEIVGLADIKIRAKIVDTTLTILTEKYVETKLVSQELPKSSLQQLAQGLIRDFVPLKNGIMRKPIFWASTATIASSVWLYWEDKNVNENHNSYDAAKTIENATKARIATEKSVTRRDIALTSTIVSGATLMYFTAPIFWKKVVKPIFAKNDEAEFYGDNNKVRLFSTDEKLQIGLYPIIVHDEISVSVRIHF